jgi:hypothetical protein
MFSFANSPDTRIKAVPSTSESPARAPNMWDNNTRILYLKNVGCFSLAVLKKNSMVWVRERTIPTERPSLVVEVIANFLRIEGSTWSAWRIPRPYSWFSRQEPLLFYQVASVVLTRLSGPHFRPTTFFPSSAGNRTRTSGSVAKNSDY